METIAHEQTVAATKSAVAGGTNIAKIAANPKRVGIIIGNGTGSTVYLNVNDAPDAGQGTPIASISVQELWIARHGTAITGDMQVRCNAPGDTIWYTEFVKAP